MWEIKFRGKRCDTGEWVYGYFYKGITTDEPLCVGDCRINHVIIEKWTMWHVIPETVGQYAGMKDKNGTGIYCGDKLEDGDEGFFVVRYCEKTARFVLDLYGYDEDGGNLEVIDTLGFDAFHGTAHLTVIGNIYDKEESK